MTLVSRIQCFLITLELLSDFEGLMVNPCFPFLINVGCMSNRVLIPCLSTVPQPSSGLFDLEGTAAQWLTERCGAETVFDG